MSGETTDPLDPRLTHGVDAGPVPQAEVYLVMSAAERAKGFVRPVHLAYVHTRGCGSITTMSRGLAETYAAKPTFYGATYCTGDECHRHCPVAEFDWVPNPGETIPPEHRAVGT